MTDTSKMPARVRWNGKTSDLPENERYCTCCGRELSAAHRMLEHDQRTGGYHDFNDVPEFHSQGWFPFGLTCAEKSVRHETNLRKSLSAFDASNGDRQAKHSGATHD